jgi:hypothetical protein
MDNDSGRVLGVMWLGLMAWLLWPGNGDHWNDTLWWSVKYRVNYSGVHISPKPADCDFLHAPLGIKGCSFKSRVSAYNAAGNFVGGDDAPKYGNDAQTGRPIISWDNGKTWDWYPASTTPDKTVQTVEVRWTKVTD